MKKYKLLALVLLLSLLLATLVAIVATRLVRAPTSDTISNSEAGSSHTNIEYETVLEGLNKPWGIGFLPDERIVFTERSGAISVYRDGLKTELLIPDNQDKIIRLSSFKG